MNADLLLTDCLRAAPWGTTVTGILAAALGAVDPAAAVHRHLQRDGDVLRAGDHAPTLQIAERPEGTRLQIEEPNLQSAINNLQLVAAGHPIPDERGVAGAR